VDERDERLLFGIAGAAEFAPTPPVSSRAALLGQLSGSITVNRLAPWKAEVAGGRSDGNADLARVHRHQFRNTLISHG